MRKQYLAGNAKAFTLTFKGSWLLKRLQTTVPEIGHLPSLTPPTKEVHEVRGQVTTGVGGMFLDF